MMTDETLDHASRPGRRTLGERFAVGARIGSDLLEDIVRMHRGYEPEMPFEAVLVYSDELLAGVGFVENCGYVYGLVRTFVKQPRRVYVALRSDPRDSSGVARGNYIDIDAHGWTSDER